MASSTHTTLGLLPKHSDYSRQTNDIWRRPRVCPVRVARLLRIDQAPGHARAAGVPSPAGSADGGRPLAYAPDRPARPRHAGRARARLPRSNSSNRPWAFASWHNVAIGDHRCERAMTGTARSGTGAGHSTSASPGFELRSRHMHVSLGRPCGRRAPIPLRNLTRVCSRQRPVCDDAPLRLKRAR